MSAVTQKVSLILLIVVSFLPLNSFTAFAQKPVDFSGRWKLDFSKSDTIPGATSVDLVIIQKGDEITINRTIETNSTNPVKGEFKYTMGKSTESSSQAGTSVTTCAWSADRQSFSVTDVIISEKNGAKEESKRVSTYSITRDGMTLTIISDDTHPAGWKGKGKGHFKQVFIKS